MPIPDGEVEPLKEYLKIQLGPICDAEPAVLAEYVVALLKHEKSSADLKELCLSQLVDFLGDHTTRFVDDLFDAVASKSYLVQRGTIATQPLPAASATADSASGANASATEGGGGRRRGGFDSDAEDDDDDRNFKHRRSGQDTHMDIVDDRGGEPSGGKAIETYEGGHPNGGGGGGGFQKRRRDDGWEDRDGRPGKMMRGPPRGGFGGPMAPPPRFDGRWGGPPGPMMMPPPPGAFDMNAPFFRGGPPGFRGGRGGFRGGPGGNAPFGGPPVERRRGRCFDYDQKGYCLRGDMCPYDHGDDRIVVESGGVGGAEVFTPRDRRPDVMTLNPEGADQDMMDTSNDRGTRPSGRGRGGFASNRGSTIGRPAIAKGQPRSDNTLVVEKIPDEFCSIEKINEFFKKFGTIVNIQVDPRNSKATIQFSKPYEARQAYNSPEVVFGNRFVKVYYLALEQGQQGPGTLGGSAAMDISPSASPKLPAEPPKPTLTPEEQAEREAKLKEIREQEEKVKKEQLHAKIMLAKLQAKEAMQAKAAEDAAKKTTAEEQKKLELDKDLEMHAAGEQGQLKNMLESKVAELQAEAKALGVAPGSPFSRGGGPSRPPRGATRGASWRGRGRGAVANTLASMRLDLRPRKLLVSNYEPEEQAQIRSHFEAFGNVESVAFREDSNMAIVEYKTRPEAENAFAKGTKLGEKTLNISWFSETTYSSRGGEEAGAFPTTGNKANTADMADVNVDLYEEEEDDEDRRWRR